MTNTYFVAIIPPYSITRRIRQIQRTTRTDERQDPALKIPHIALQEPFRTRRILEVVNSLEHIASSTMPFEIRIAGAGGFGDDDAILQVERSRRIANLHAQVIDAVREFRTDYYHPRYDREDFRKARFTTLLHYGNLMPYGTPFARGEYEPHITIASGLHPMQARDARRRAQDLRISGWQADAMIVVCESQTGALTESYVLMLSSK